MIPGVELEEFVRTAGYFVLFAVIFAESGLFFGFFLPGDSLLFTAGVFAARGDLSIGVLLAGFFIAAVTGDQVGYLFGRKVGTRLYSRPDSRLFKKEHVHKAQAYFDKHGSKTIVLARFVPIVRTFAPIVAGVGNMDYRRFVTFNVLGGLLWAIGVTLAGFLLGEVIGHDTLDKYLLPIIALIVAVSLLPVVIEALKARRTAVAARSADTD